MRTPDRCIRCGSPLRESGPDYRVFECGAKWFPSSGWDFLSAEKHCLIWAYRLPCQPILDKSEPIDQKETKD